MSDPDHAAHDAKGREDGGETEAEGLTLDALLQSIHDSLSEQVRSSSERALEQLLAHYMPIDQQTGLPMPRMVEIPVPGPNGTPIRRDIPLFSLVRHHDIAVESMVVRMKLGLEEGRGPDGKPSLLVRLDEDEPEKIASAEIEIRFRGVEAAEGLARINDAIVKHIGIDKP